MEETAVLHSSVLTPLYLLTFKEEYKGGRARVTNTVNVLNT